MSFDATHINGVINLLALGLSGQRAREVNAQLDDIRATPWFVPVLHLLFKSESCPSPNPPVDLRTTPWLAFRQIAALTIKNTLTVTLQAHGKEPLVPVGQTASQIVVQSSDRLISASAAQIIAKITSLLGVGWWAESAGIDLPNLLLNDMMAGGDERVANNALLVVEYLLEDASATLGETCSHIINAVATLCAKPGLSVPLLRRSTSTLIFPFEIGLNFDWNVANLQPFQYGLCNSVVGMVQVATQLMSTHGVDVRVAQACIRGCGLSIDYASYLSGDQLQAYMASAQHWCAGIVHFAIMRETDALVASEAFDLATSMLLQDQSTGQLDNLGFIAAIKAHLSGLMPNIFQAQLMRDAEVQAMLENDHIQARDAHHKRSSAHSKKVKRVGENDDDEAVTGMTLRDSAGRCLDALAVGLPDDVFPYVVAFAETHWGNPDWRFRELCTLFVGAVARGCERQLLPYMPAFVQQLAAAVNSPNEHVAVRSMSLWALMRFSPWIFDPNTSQPNYIAGALQAMLGALGANSKRIQWAAITALKEFIRVSLDFDPTGAPLHVHLAEAFAAITACAGAYHSNNLAVLCDLTCSLIPLMSDATVVGATAVFQSEHDKRLGTLAQTLDQRYRQNDPRCDVDEDAFEFARVLCCAISSFPLPFGARPMEMLNTYLTIITTIAGYDTSDNPGLVSYPLHIAAGLFVAIPTAELAQWVTSTSSRLALAAVAGIKSDETDAISAGCMILNHHLRCLRTLGVQGGSEFIVQGLVPALHFSKNPVAATDALMTLLTVLRAFSADEGQCPSADATLPAALAQVRGDMYENFFMNAYACTAGEILAIRPQFATCAVLKELCMCLRSQNNHPGKAEATKGVCIAVAALASHSSEGHELVVAMLEEFIKLLMSWQTEATGYEGLCQAGNHALTQHLAGPFAGIVTQVIQKQPQKQQTNLRQQFIGA